MTDPPAPAPQPVGWQSATVADILVRTPRIKSFFLAPSKPFLFAAGQHVNVRLTAPDGYHAIRSYSIASAPETTATFELAIERLDEGEVSPFFHDTVRAGDAIDILGPLGGYFLWPPSVHSALLLAAGGSGVVPLMSMLRHRRATGSTVPTVLLYSTRTWDDALYRDELLELEGRNDGFTLAFALTRDKPRRAVDFARRVDGAMMVDVCARVPSAPQDAFVCGANHFVDTAADAALAAGIPSLSIRTERYGV